MRIWLLFLVAATLLSAATFRLYLKDGTFQKVKEYQVNGDRLKYLSAERGDWEEIPTELVDLSKTEGELKAAKDADAADNKAEAEEKQAEAEMRKEIRSVPKETGAYYLSPKGEITPLKLAEAKFVTNKRRSILAALSPIPAFSGKATLEIDSLSSAFKLMEDRPYFYLRQESDQRMDLVRLKPNGRKVGRVVQNLEILPVIKETVTTMDNVETFKRQVAEGLYRIWPTETIERGEYALVEYTEGKNAPKVYDFSRQ